MQERSCSRIEKIEADFKKISPLALPQYLLECEFYDMKDVQEVLDDAIKEFDKNGGLAGNLADTILAGTVNAGCLVLLKKYHKPTYDKAIKGKINFAGIVKQVKNFSYPTELFNTSASAEKVNNNLMQDQLKRENSGISKKYKRKEWDNEEKKQEFKDNAFGNKNETKDAIGVTVYKTQEDAINAGADPELDIGTVDHKKSLASLHECHGCFGRRYIGQQKMNEIVNSPENLQMLNKSSNSSKGDKSAGKWTDDLTKRLGNKPDDPQRKRKKKAVEKKPELTEEEKKADAALQKKILCAGASTVLFEQIGKMIETVVGPLSFEIKDILKNGVTNGFNTEDPLECFFLRLWRGLKYILSELPKLIGEFLGDLGQMIAAFFAEACKIIRDLFGKYIEIALSGISIIIEAVKVLLKPDTNVSQKGDAICKLMIAFATNIAGNFLLSALLDMPSFAAVPQFLKELISITVSALTSSIVTYIFDKLDIFNVKRELRNQRIKEIFDLRREQLEEDAKKFDIAVMEKLKQQRMQYEKLKHHLSQTLQDEEFVSLNEGLDCFADFFQVAIPYSTTAEFISFIKANNGIRIT